MVPGWCKYAWMYANQAKLLDINVYIYCTDNDNDDNNNIYIDKKTSISHWTRHLWGQVMIIISLLLSLLSLSLQGPRVLKSSNVTVDTKVLKTIINEITSITNTNTNTNTYTKIYTSKGIIDNYYDDDNDITCIGTKFSDYNHHTNNNINVDINTNTNTNTISNIEDNIVSVFITEASVNINTNGNYVVSFMGEISTRHHPRLLFEAFPHLSICLEVMNDVTDPWCFHLR